MSDSQPVESHPAPNEQSTIDLLGLMAYGELSAFERLAYDARFSPTLADRKMLGALAVSEFEHFERVSATLGSLGADVDQAMEPFRASVDFFHERTRPADWYESLMKAYVADSVSSDFYREVADFLPESAREVVQSILSDAHSGDQLRDRLRRALDEDPRLSSRLALWGRRLVGEALTQAQRIAIERAVLMGLGVDQHPELAAAISTPLMARLTQNHSRRMSELGLTA